MPQVFKRRADTRLRLAAALLAALAALAGGFVYAQARSDWAWLVGVPAPQPIPYSHAVHAGGLGLDCRFCHASVEHAASAGMPTAETCLGCHREVWNVAAQFTPLRTALALGTPVEWASVHRLPGHIHFHHGAHIAAGVACETCHGKVWEMPQTVKTETLSMGWCLDCHRDPAPHLRPASAVFDREWTAPAAPPPGLDEQPVVYNGIEVSPLTRCSTCHR